MLVGAMKRSGGGTTKQQISALNKEEMKKMESSCNWWVPCYQLERERRTMEFVIPQHLNLDSTEQNLFLWVIRPFWRDTKTLFRCSMSGWQTPIYFEVKRGDFSNIPGNAILSATYIHLSEDPLAQYLNYSRNLRAMTGSRVIPQKSKFLSLSLSVTLSSTPLSTFTCGARRQTAISKV